MTKPSLDDLTPEQRRALLAYKERMGRHWKWELNLAWQSGRDAVEPDGALLRQIRNQRGPTWLHNLVIKETK